SPGPDSFRTLRSSDLIVAGGAVADVRLTNDFPGGGYVSAYTLATGNVYSDATLAECSRSRGRQNEPAVAVNPRNISVLIGSSNRSEEHTSELQSRGQL